MIITNLNIDAELVADSQKYGGMHNRIVGIFWSCKYATKGKWINDPFDMNREGYFLDDTIWIEHLAVDPGWNTRFQNAANRIREITGKHGWKL